jgi:ferredoxin--NADP+ reductase
MSGASLGTEGRPLRVAVVGSGPSGFYAIQSLFKARKKEGLQVSVDLFDRLPTPYGLVRGGVAPDHQNIKAVIKAYDKIAAEPGFRFFGHVVLGRDIQVADLLAHYDQVVYATGNESDRPMGIPGEDLSGVHSATEFVGWFNGHPDFRDRTFDLSNARRIAVVGNGNVAMDVVRVMARDPDELADTDIADYALEVLRQSAVEEIFLLGRRGPAQAAFSPKEIKEVGSLSYADLVIPEGQMDLDPLSRTWLAEKADRDAQKNVEYLSEKAKEGPQGKRRRIICEFLVSPVEVLGEDGRCTAVRLERNQLYPEADGTPRPRGTGETRVEPVQLVFKAIGYKGVPIPGVPFDARRGIFPNRDGRLFDPERNEVRPGEYVVGWAKRGPTGLIGTNSPDSAATVDVMLEDLKAGRVEPAATPPDEAIPALLAARGVDYASWEDWRHLDQDEVARGQGAGKIREKYTTLEEMMAAVRRLRG